MGKKSRKIKSSGARKAGDKTGLAADLNKKLTIAPSGASCWICLLEPEDSDEPIRRDCSCRGDSGWAHLSCVIKYAESKSEEWLEKNGEIYYGTGLRAGGVFDTDGNGLGESEPWMACPNCKRAYCNQFAIDMVDGMVEFTKKRFPCDPDITTCDHFSCDPFKYSYSLTQQLVTIYHACAGADGREAAKIIVTGRKVVEDILSLSARMRKCLRHDRITQSLERITASESLAFKLRGDLGLSEVAIGLVDSKKDGAKAVAKDYEKSIELSKSIGDSFSAGNTEMELRKVRSLLSSGVKEKQRDAKENIHHLRDRMKMLGSLGVDQNSTQMFSLQFDLANALNSGGHVIEAERILRELIGKSRRVMGDSHYETKGVEELHSVVNTRRFQFRNGDSASYKLLRYSGEKCVIRGPMTFEKYGEGEGKIMTVDIADVGFLPPAPVVCVGLKGATHLNGKIGDAREYDPKKERYMVVFEDPSLKSAFVKYENLRVLTDVPEKDE
jgi:hypothetical protein